MINHPNNLTILTSYLVINNICTVINQPNNFTWCTSNWSLTRLRTNYCYHKHWNSTRRATNFTYLKWHHVYVWYRTNWFDLTKEKSDCICLRAEKTNIRDLWLYFFLQEVIVISLTNKNKYIGCHMVQSLVINSNVKIICTNKHKGNPLIGYYKHYRTSTSTQV